MCQRGWRYLPSIEKRGIIGPFGCPWYGPVRADKAEPEINFEMGQQNQSSNSSSSGSIRVRGNQRSRLSDCIHP